MDRYRMACATRCVTSKSWGKSALIDSWMMEQLGALVRGGKGITIGALADLPELGELQQGVVYYIAGSMRYSMVRWKKCTAASSSRSRRSFSCSCSSTFSESADMSGMLAPAIRWKRLSTRLPLRRRMLYASTA